MIKSMTGYGKGQGQSENLALTVEIKTVNHRYGDINIKSPRFLMGYDNEIKKQISERLRRGKIDVYISQEAQDAVTAAPVLNRPLAEAYVEIFRKMEAYFDLKDGIPLSLLAEQRDVITQEDFTVDKDEVLSCLRGALDQALDAVEQMRISEGTATQKDIEHRLSLAEEILEQIRQRAPVVAEEWRDKLLQRLERLAGEVEFDDQRVAQEVALFADRCDISEEVSRFLSHLQQFRALMLQEAPVGRQIDFLVQEMNRETNTMGSKSNDSELTRQVVQLKAELEKVREQAQNVE